MALGLTIERLDGIARVTLDDPDRPLNTLGEAALGAFETALDELEADPPERGVVLRSAKPGSFVAGADLVEFQGITEAGEAERLLLRGQAMLGRWQRLAVPSVAAIHGAALGGGLELALGCTWRLASDDPATTLGLPETRLGLLPALAGTWHLPRLVGLERGVAMILAGRQLNAAQALGAGLVDEVVPRAELDAAAERRLAGPAPARRPSPLRDWLLAGNPLGRMLFFGAARKRVVARTGGHYPAPVRALETIETGYARGREAALAAEAKNLGELLTGDVARRLIELFLATRELAGGPEGDGEPGTLGVLGAGFMGSGIAAAAARAGYRVRMMDASAGALERGVAFCRGRLASLEKRGKLTREAARAANERLLPAASLEGFEEAGLVVEAVVEELEVKQALLAELEPRLASGAVLGSNTSTIPIGRLAEALEHPERLVGIHFFSPVHRMPLVEIIRHPGSSEAAVERARELARRLGKTPIAVRDGPGFYTSRILSPYLAQGAALLLEGAGIAEVDRAARRVGFPVGPLELLDEVGIDVAARAAGTMAAAFPERMPSPEGFRKLVEEGRLGRKAGRGFYDYSGKKKRPDPAVLAPLEGERRTAPLDLEAAGERLVLAMAAEAVRCLEEGILAEPRDGDVGAVLGLGFPPFTGGPFRYLDALGWPQALARLEALTGAHGAVFEAPGVLRGERGRFHG